VSSIRGRLARLEKTAGGDGPCPSCPPPQLLDAGAPEPPPCSHCGRVLDVIFVEEVVVPSLGEAS
jgi:hypothetical protein